MKIVPIFENKLFAYLITGGAIKMSQKMESHPDTAIELVKLANARNYLMQEDVIDDLSFYELMIN